MSKEKVLRRAQLLVKLVSMSILAMLALSAFLIANGVSALAAAAAGDVASASKGLTLIGAGLAVGLACIGGGYAVGQAGAAMIAAMTEKPEYFGRMFIILVLGEGIALYGLLISILLWISA
ncbi:H+transporting two-sector ATPase C subunit [Pyrolobus fumarii 1A]|uniref:H+transporting two-sector ATPase C subunit n=1 Tax=Pyrolobus fumarii (strain DSM 11204 / 1A) TaxID=694429 RepID=G0EDR2_PYRF1|nr:ATP synthase subunit C [Pyrolobus fumarii]AEM38681.1 H+transporting two-sector ATPase C subunit [Pyrolobus fumarii 1A]